MQICPSGRRAKSSLCEKVSELFSVHVLFSFQTRNRRLTLLFVLFGDLMCVCVWGVAVLFECCDALLAAFYKAYKFNADLSKWLTGTVTDMYRSKCTLLGVDFFSNKNTYVHTCRRLKLLFVFLGLVVFFVCGMLSFSLNVVVHSLQCLLTHLISIKICPSGRRARSPIWNIVSVLFSRCCFLFRQETCTCTVGDSHFFCFFGDWLCFFVCGVLSFSL